MSDVCAVDGCDFGTGQPARCGQGSWRPECMINWLETDPDDREPYREYLDQIPDDRRSTRRAAR